MWSASVVSFHQIYLLNDLLEFCRLNPAGNSARQRMGNIDQTILGTDASNGLFSAEVRRNGLLNEQGTERAVGSTDFLTHNDFERRHLAQAQSAVDLVMIQHGHTVKAPSLHCINQCIEGKPAIVGVACVNVQINAHQREVSSVGESLRPAGVIHVPYSFGTCSSTAQPPAIGEGTWPQAISLAQIADSRRRPEVRLSGPALQEAAQSWFGSVGCSEGNTDTVPSSALHEGQDGLR